MLLVTDLLSQPWLPGRQHCLFSALAGLPPALGSLEFLFFFSQYSCVRMGSVCAWVLFYFDPIVPSSGGR